MERFEKIAPVANDIEALALTGELEKRAIPHVMRTYYDTAYDGLFQFSGGWGHVEAPAEHRDEICNILEGLRRQSSAQDQASEQ